MKILKKAEQKNFIVNQEYYVESDIYKLFNSGEVFFFSNDLKSSHNFNAWVETGKPEIRIFAEMLTEVKVVCIDGFYETVAIGKNGTTYYVCI